MENEVEFSQDVVEQYELVRKSGVCNMFDMFCVAKAAKMLKYKELAEIAADRQRYAKLLLAYSQLMAMYGITQN